MAHVQAWRRFRRMQGAASVVGALIYAGAAVHAWRVLPGPMALKASMILVFPGFFALLAFLLPLQVRVVRRWLKRYVWMSYTAGFGQTPASVLAGLGLLGFAAVFIYLQSEGVAHGGRYPAGVFSGYGSGVGILFAQWLLGSAMERDPEVRAAIED